jgi:hypothetical protein
MIDFITIQSRISDAVCEELVRRHHLQQWRSEDGMMEYHHGETSRFSGIQISIKHNVLKLRVSLHKYWNIRCFGTYDNYTRFDRVSAIAAFLNLMSENKLIPSQTKILKFELGLNLHVTQEPVKFIELIRGIGSNGKCMFNDANYQINRQKTTEKHKNIRKYFKIYDKGFEIRDKSHTKDARDRQEEKYILRIETIHKRCNMKADHFLSNSNMNKLMTNFWDDWSSAVFCRHVRAQKGKRKSEQERAEKLLKYGKEEYLARVCQQLQNKQITSKQYRTIREFIRDFEKNKMQYSAEISDAEDEFFRLLRDTYTICVR